MAKLISYSKEMAILNSPRPQTSLCQGNGLSAKRLCQQKRARPFTARVSCLVGMFLMGGINERKRNSGQCGQCVHLCCCCSVTKLCPTLWPHRLQHTRLPCPSLSPRVCSNSCPLIWWCHPTISSSVAPLFLHSMFPSIRVFSKELTLPNRWPKYWELQLSINPSSDYSESTSCRIDWFDLLAAQATPKSLLQHHISKVSVLRAQPSLWSRSHIHTCLLEKS